MMYPDLALLISLDASLAYNYPAFEFFIKESKLLQYVSDNNQHFFTKKIPSYLTLEDLTQKKEHFLSLMKRIFPTKKFQEEDILLHVNHG